MRRQHQIVYAFPRITCKQGFSAIAIMLAIMIAVGLITAGIMMLGPLVTRGKTVESQKGMDGAAGAIISWSVANNRIPDSLAGVTDFRRVIGNPNDAWGNPFVYIYSGDLLNGICNRRTTALRVSPVADDIAFVIISGGNDYNVSSIPNTSQALNGTVAVSQNDIVKWVTLEELKNKAGCYGPTQGRLTILNNELPSACIGLTYNANVYSDGGVLPYGNWTATGLPAGLAIISTSGKISGIPTGAAQTYNITFSRTDSNTNTVQKTLPIKVENCVIPPPANAQITFSSNIGSFSTQSSSSTSVQTSGTSLILGGNQTNSWGCFWYPTAQPVNSLQAFNRSTMRAYMTFTANNDTHAQSQTYGDGFTFALMTGNNNVTTANYCGNTGMNLGFAGTAPVAGYNPIGQNSVAIEYDTYPNNAAPATGKNDHSPATLYHNHVAVVQYGSNAHNTTPVGGWTSNAICRQTTPNQGCVFGNQDVFGNNFPINWFENATRSPARMEVRTGCTSTSCATCAAGGNYASVRVWMGCIGCNDLLANYTAVPTVDRCLYLPYAQMPKVIFGFTEGTSAVTQNIVVDTFGISFFWDYYTIKNVQGATFYARGGQYTACTTVGNGGNFRINLADTSPVNLYTNNTCTTAAGLPQITYSSVKSIDDAGNKNSMALVNSSWQLIDDTTTTILVENHIASGTSFWVRGGQYPAAPACTVIPNGSTFNVNSSDASSVTAYSDSTCATARRAVSYATAYTTDQAGDKNNRVYINGLWALVDSPYYAYYTVYNSQGGYIRVLGGQYTACTRITNATGTFRVNATDATPVSVYTNAAPLCGASQLRTSVSYTQARTTDDSGNRERTIQINSAWGLIDR